MQRTQIQLPEPLYIQIKELAHSRDWSVAEFIRRGMEAYVQTCALPDASPWQMPVLRGSGGHKVNPADLRLEADVITSRIRDDA